jgi:hypothetical protein
MFKLGQAKTKKGETVFIYDITPTKIFAIYMLQGVWTPGVWVKGGHYVGPGFESEQDLEPNEVEVRVTKILAYASKNGIVRFAVEGSQESLFYDQDSMNMTRLPKFDLLGDDV